MTERTPLPAAYIARIHAAAQRTCGSVERRRDWPNTEWSSPVIVMSLCAEIARLNIELQRATEAEGERCASIALAIDSGRGNEKEIAKAIRRAVSGEAKP